MNLQSKFGYSIITQTLTIAHNVCKLDGITNRQTDGQTDDNPITRCPRRTFQAGGINITSIIIFILCDKISPLHLFNEIRCFKLDQLSGDPLSDPLSIVNFSF